MTTFLMVTTYFGPHSFGGDAAYVDRLSRALARRGHEVHVAYCQDAWEATRAGQGPRPYVAPPGVTVRPFRSPWGPLSPTLTHQTGRPWLKRGAYRALIEEVRPDVVHFHNLSLVGGPGLLGEPAGGAIKLMTAHEHWLVCPLSVLWKNDEALCESKDCARCCLKAGRPPQWWRDSGLLERSLESLDALIAPSESTRREHARRGLKRPMARLPYFLPVDYLGAPARPAPRHERPYVALAGRLEKYKGVQDAIDAVARLPQLDLRIAGTGRHEAALKDRAAGLTNVHFEGALDGPGVAALFRGARAIVVPSLVFETFGYVLLEAFAEGRPVIVRELGALPEIVEECQGGLTFDSTETMGEAIDRLTRDEGLGDALGENGRRALQTVWSEEAHLRRYFGIIALAERRREKRTSSESRPNNPKGDVVESLRFANG